MRMRLPDPADGAGRGASGFAERSFPMMELLLRRISYREPEAMISPPSFPAPGPSSMI